MHDFNPLRDFFGPVILIVILLIGFGVMSGANTKALVSAFLDLVVSILKVVMLALAKILPPLTTALIAGLKLITNKTLEVTIKAIEHKPPDQQTTNGPTTSTTGGQTGGQTQTQQPDTGEDQPPVNPVVTGLKKAYDSTAPKKKPSANPYEEDPEIEIIEK